MWSNCSWILARIQAGSWQILRGSTAKVISGRISIIPKSLSSKIVIINTNFFIIPKSVSSMQYTSKLLIYVIVSKKKKSQTKMQDQGLSGYSAAPLTSSAPLRLGKCRVSWVGLGYAFRPSGAAATDTPHLASSRYRLARLRADMTLPVHL